MVKPFSAKVFHTLSMFAMVVDKSALVIPALVFTKLTKVHNVLPVLS